MSGEAYPLKQIKIIPLAKGATHIPFVIM